KPHTFDEPAEVLAGGGEVELDLRRDARVLAREREAASREWPFQRDRETDRERRADRCDRPLAADSRYVDVAEDGLLHVVEFVRRSRGVAQDNLRKRRLEVAAAWPRHEQQARDGVVDQIRTDSRQLDERLDGQVEQRVFRPDP